MGEAAIGVEGFATSPRRAITAVGIRTFAPFIATWLARQTGTPIAPTFYLIAAGLVSGAAIPTFRETAFERLR